MHHAAKAADERLALDAAEPLPANFPSSLHRAGIVQMAQLQGDFGRTELQMQLFPMARALFNPSPDPTQQALLTAVVGDGKPVFGYNRAQREALQKGTLTAGCRSSK